jgi:hypothetical protein
LAIFKPMVGKEAVVVKHPDGLVGLLVGQMEGGQEDQIQMVVVRVEESQMEEEGRRSCRAGHMAGDRVGRGRADRVEVLAAGCKRQINF